MKQQDKIKLSYLKQAQKIQRDNFLNEKVDISVHVSHVDSGVFFYVSLYDNTKKVIRSIIEGKENNTESFYFHSCYDTKMGQTISEIRKTIQKINDYES